MRSSNTRRSPAVWQVKISPITWSWRPGHDITPSLGPLGIEDMHVRWASVKAPPGMLMWNMTWLVDLAGIVWHAAEVRAVAPMVTILTLGEGLAVLNIVVISATLCIEEGVMAGMIGLGVVKVVAGMVDLIVGHVSKGGCAVDDPRGDAIVGIGISEGLGTFKVLFGNDF
jgi:hypothetical protein